MKVGSFCGISFQVSDNEVRTIDSFQWSATARYSTHQRHGSVDLPEHTGTQLEKISFSMTLTAYLGVDPMTLYKKFRNLVSTGQHGAFVLGRKRVGSGSWTAISSSITGQTYDGHGAVTTAQVKVTLQEYPRS